MQISSRLVRATFIWLSASANFWKNFLHTLEINISLQSFNIQTHLQIHTTIVSQFWLLGAGGGGKGGVTLVRPDFWYGRREGVWHLWPLGVRTVESTYTGCSSRTMPARGHQISRLSIVATGHHFVLKKNLLKGLSYEIDFDNVDENWQILALISATAGFWIFGGTSDF